ncbi:MAG: RluA family pseudouridine synthase [Clostridia bacterium]|nr:RluA family pseudouridine synthase [Clostridia bacterium]
MIILILEYIVSESDNNKSLKHILKNNMNISNVLLIKLKNSQSILVNNKLVNVNELVHLGEKISVNIDNITDSQESFLSKFEPWDFDLDILFEDEYLLIVNKPYNMPVHPSSGNYTNTLANAVINYLNKDSNIAYHIHIVTRLDKDTSGICIFAKNSYIQELFVRKKDIIDIKKIYIAITKGIIEKETDIICENICRKPNSIILREVSSDKKIGDYAKTEYFVLNRNYDKNYTIVKVILHTGRTHQIRVHMSHIGHILLGDELYANEYRINDIRELINRQALHAHIIEFNHPITMEKIHIECDLPEDMKKLYN